MVLGGLFLGFNCTKLGAEEMESAALWLYGKVKCTIILVLQLVLYKVKFN